MIGFCFRDQVLKVCPELSRYSQTSTAGIQKTFEGSSLETIRHMVASGIGITVLPWTAMPPGIEPGVEGKNNDGLLTYVPFEKTPPVRQVMLVWRKSFGRVEAVEELHDCLVKLEQPGVMPLDVPCGMGVVELGGFVNGGFFRAAGGKQRGGQSKQGVFFHGCNS